MRFDIKSTIYKFLILFLISEGSYSQSKSLPNNNCQLTDSEIDLAIKKIIENKNIARNLPSCEKSNRNFIPKLIELDYKYFAYVGDDIRDDDNFIRYFVTKYPGILEFISPRLKKDQSFFFYISTQAPEVLKYADSELLDSKIFMIKMIGKDPEYYSYASDRLRNDYDVTMAAVKNNGEMLKYASGELLANKKIALAAISSYTPAINFIDINLQKDKQIQKITKNIKYDYLDNLGFYLKENYSGLPVGPKGNRGYRIVNRGKFYIDQELIKHPNITKWKMIYKDGQPINEYEVEPNKEDSGWKIDLKKYPGLIKQVEKILKDNRIDQNTINAMNLTALWEVTKKPQTLAFDLYLLRNIEHKYLKPNSINITSLMLIAKKNKKDWTITIVDGIFDVNIEMDMNFKGGYKKYRIWDLYKTSEEDKNPKILFRIEDEDSEYFELYAPQPSGVYAKMFQGEGYSN